MAEVTSTMSSAAAGAVELAAVHTVHERGNGEGQDGAWLTVIAASVKAGSGKVGAERGGEADLRRPRRGKAPGRRFGALPVT